MAINDRTPTGLFRTAWDNSAHFIAKNPSNWASVNAGKRKPLADILEIALENYKDRLAEGRHAYLCISLVNLLEAGKLNQIEVNYAQDAITHKIKGAQTLAIYLAETYPHKGAPGYAESFEARTPKDVTYEEKIEFWETWIAELRAAKKKVTRKGNSPEGHT